MSVIVLCLYTVVHYAACVAYTAVLLYVTYLSHTFLLIFFSFCQFSLMMHSVSAVMM